MVEVITRLADFQAQLRAARIKVRDVGADRLVFVIAGTTANRRTLGDVGATLNDAFPIRSRDALSRLGVVRRGAPGDQIAPGECHGVVVAEAGCSVPFGTARR